MSANRGLGYKQLDSGSAHLTPRTPRSTRTGRPVTSFKDIEDDEDDYVPGFGARSGGGGRGGRIEETEQETQTYPLLRSSTSATFPEDVHDSHSRYAPSPRSWSSRPAHSSTPTTTATTRQGQGQGFRSRLKFQQFDNVRLKRVAESTPLILGVFLSLILLILLLLSVHRPSVLREYILKNSTDPQLLDKLIVGGGGAMIDYTNRTNFPLEAIEYEEECWSLMQKHGGMRGGYWDQPKPKPAESTAAAAGSDDDDDDILGLLDMEMDVPHEHQPGEHDTCSSTITYMLDGEVGLFYDLALIAQTAAFARERNRTFIIDDSRWNRGNWTDHFQDVRKTQPGPEPNCLPPPANELVVTQRTAKFHFGHMFADNYENPYKYDVSRQKPIYDHAYNSFKNTILPSNYIRRQLTRLRQHFATKPYIGIHIRHGDRYPTNQKWRGDYVPMSEFTKATKETWNTLRTADPSHYTDFKPTVYIASDSYAALEDYKSLAGATVESIGALQTSGDHTWRYMASPHGYVQRVFNGRKTRQDERIRWTQGVILDFAMMSGAWLADGERGPGASICTASSNICRMAAVALGWERAFDQKRWVDADWQGIVYPPWEAFEYH
ncbi:hypothetical protein FRC20_004316 [Serendipita sp. 405]|nr:hypothetical protein FRC20_004316 [Serendipita sp. 405]